MTRWLWAGRSASARLARLSLLPLAFLYRGMMGARARAYGARLIRCHTLPIPTVSVGNLTVGGSGKTPLAGWIASYFAARGIPPAIVLRGYGGDEGEVHQSLVPSAIVVDDPDRRSGVRTAMARGARVAVLDDAFQRLELAPDLNIAVVSAESSRAVRWTLPAGPWREPWSALRRADLVVVTRKQADWETAAQVAARVAAVAPGVPVAGARLAIAGFRTLRSRDLVPVHELDGARVLASAGVADPDSFAAQCAVLGATVELLPFPDHHLYPERDIRRLLHAARTVDYVVVTEKDAVKLQDRWPGAAPEPLVAQLEIVWEGGRRAVDAALDAIVADVTEHQRAS